MKEGPRVELVTVQAAPVACVVRFYAAGDFKLLMLKIDEQFQTEVRSPSPTGAG